MSQDYELDFGTNPNEQPQNQTGVEITDKYKTASNVRKICFIWPDGRMKTKEYALLDTMEYEPEEGTIKLVFSTEKITIKGSNLQILFKEMFWQITMKVECEEKRYQDINETHEIYNIESIKIEKA